MLMVGSFSARPFGIWAIELQSAAFLVHIKQRERAMFGCAAKDVLERRFKVSCYKMGGIELHSRVLDNVNW